jgi:23S rRNA pseudouridine955/2504/2580 synthase
MAAMESRTVEADEAGMRLDRWFKTHYPELSFGHLQKLLRSGQIRVDGGRVKANARLDQGQSVRVPPLARTASPDSAKTGAAGLKPGPARLRPDDDAGFLRSIMLYEDDLVFVLNKPAGLAVQGGSGLTRHVDAMLEALRDRKGQKPRLVHRLDRDTSGVLVIAKTRLAAQRLAESFRSRSTRKIYWALVRGVPKPKQGRISTWLAKEGTPDGDRMRIARHGEENASHAVSLYSVVETAGQKLAWLSMRPVTGRTHQLRAHAAHIDHPIIGDPKYFEAEESWDFPGGIQKKLHLHARRIVIPHPSGEGTLDVTAPMAPHMQQSWNLLGFETSLGDAVETYDDE